MIIFGFRSKVHTLAMLSRACSGGHTAAHRLAQRTRWFTLFFIPIIPVAKTHFMVCTGCGQTQKLNKAEADQLIAQPPVAIEPGPVTTAPLAVDIVPQASR